MKDKNQNEKQSPKTEITRKEAIQKAGKLAALTAASMLILTTKAHAGGSVQPSNSPRAPRDW
jgi:hypothetical protein